MTSAGWIQRVLFGVLLLARPLGLYMAAVLDGSSRLLRVGARLESALYRCCRINATSGMSWRHYALAALLFNALGTLSVYALQRLQPRQAGARSSRPRHLLTETGVGYRLVTDVEAIPSSA